MELKIFTSPN